LADVIVRIRKVRMIQNIHEIRPERQLEFLGERELFEEPHVPIEITRAEEGIWSCVAESIRLRHGIRIWIEPLGQ